MNLVLLLQSGETGPIKIVCATERGMRRTVETLQRGNPELLHIRYALDGDERLARRLHVQFEAHHAGRDWYQPAILGQIGLDIPRWPDFDADGERRRIAALGLDVLTKRSEL